MGTETAEDLVIGDLVVHSIEWDWTTMQGMTAELWAEVRSRYSLGYGGGGFTVANADLKSEDDAHRHRMWMLVKVEGDLDLRIYRDASKLLATQISEAIKAHFGSRQELISFLSTPRGAGSKFLRSGFQEPEKTAATQQIFLPGAKSGIKIDRNGMLHHSNGKYAGAIKSITQLRVRPDGVVWYQAKAKTGRKIWKKVK